MCMSTTSVLSYRYTLVSTGVKNETYVDEPQLLQMKYSMAEACYVNCLTNEEATELNQVNTVFCMLVICAIKLIYIHRMMLKVIMKQLKCLNLQRIIQMISVKNCLTIII